MSFSQGIRKNTNHKLCSPNLPYISGPLQLRPATTHGEVQRQVAVVVTCMTFSLTQAKLMIFATSGSSKFLITVEIAP